MRRYGNDFGRPGGQGWNRYDRGDFGHFGQGGYPSGGYGRRDGGGRSYDRFFEEAREPWASTRPEHRRPMHQPYDQPYGTNVQGRTGEPWGGESDVDRVCAAEIMTSNPEAVTPDTPLAEVAKRMRDLDVGIIPVVDDPESYRLQGVITDRDITIRAVAEGKDIKKAKVAEYMTSGVETVHETDHIRDVFTVMKRDRVRRVPVTDEEGRLVGIIAQADLAISYAGLDVQREAEVEEVIERISEPGITRRGRGRANTATMRSQFGNRGGMRYDRDIGDRLRDGWDSLRREARHFLGRGYDRGW